MFQGGPYAAKNPKTKVKSKAEPAVSSGADKPNYPAQPLSTPQPTTEDTWEQFTGELARSLADLDEDKYLILTTKKDRYFVQFAGQGGFGMRTEASSNESSATPRTRLP